MADLWLKRLEREIKLRGAIVLFGNTNDIIFNPRNGQYTPVLQCVKDVLFKSGYNEVITWNKAEGGKRWNRDNTSNALKPFEINDSGKGDDYFMDDMDNSLSAPTYEKPEEFFPYLRTLIDGKNSTAVIIDYSDYLFADSRSLSDDERKNITNLIIAIERGQNYGLKFVESRGSILILLAKTTALLPPSIYVDNPLVATINVPLPGRDERKNYVGRDKSLLKLSPGVDDKAVMTNFIDALDGFNLKNIAQIIKLSNQAPERMSFEKLISLYRYGEKISPWEELDYNKLRNIQETLGRRVKGQDEAIKKVRDVIIRAYTGLAGLQHSSKQKKPKGALFFVGPTGVGKTELAKSLAEFIFGDENSYRRFDMSEYAHEESDQRLVGAPPGYVGYEKGGELTNAVKEKPFCVLLFDEIEKAHGRIMDKFLQILEDGRLTDGKGETIYFSETFIIFTSNIGAAGADITLTPEKIRKYFISEVKKHFIQELKRPEILNRIGDANIVPFNFIDNDEILIAIGKSKFEKIRESIKERYHADISFSDEDKIFVFLAKQVNKLNGGRGMLNIMEEKIIDPLSEFVFENMERIKKGGRTIKIDLYCSSGGRSDLDIHLD